MALRGFFIDFQAVANVCKNNSKKVLKMFCRLVGVLYLWGYQIIKNKKMTHYIEHQYDELLTAALPEMEIHAVYICESEIEYDDEGFEVSNRLIHISPFVNGQPAPFNKFPTPSGSKEEKMFLALLRESARQALWVKQMREENQAR